MGKSHQRNMRMAKLEDIPQPPVILPLLPPLTSDRPIEDRRFKAIALVSPGFSMLFSPESLADVSLPSLCIGAGRDRWNRGQAERFVSMLGSRAQYRSIPDADSLTFVAPVSEDDPASMLGELSRHAAPEVQKMLNARLTGMLAEFFDRTFAAVPEQTPQTEER